MSYKIQEYRKRKTWLAARRKFVGASESPILLGQGYADQSPLSLYADKIDTEEPTDEQDSYLRVGSAVEESVLRLAAEDTGLAIVPNKLRICRNEERPHIGCTVDGWAPGGETPTPVEAKLVNWAAEEWEDGGTPLKFIIQTQHQLLVTGLPRALLAGLIVQSMKLELRWIYPHKVLQEVIRDSCDEFWQRVTDGHPPDAQETRACAGALAKLYPESDAVAVELPEEYTGIHAELLLIKDEVKEKSRRQTELENQLKSAIKSHAYGVTGAGSFSWKTGQRTVYEYPEEVKQQYATKTTTRRFLASAKVPKSATVIKPAEKATA